LPVLSYYAIESAMKNTLEMLNRMQADGIIGSYAIGGAVGATFYIAPAATLDVDIFVTLPSSSDSSLVSLTPIYEYLSARGCKAEGEHIVIGDWPVQFLVAGDALEQGGLEKAIEFDVEGVPTRVMTAEHLVAIALKTGRPKDFNRILQFLGLGAVNRDKLNRILEKYGLTAKWEKFRQRYLDE
jgi:hypothetical protein